MISDLDDHLGRGIVNERTCFASCVLAFECSKLITCLECNSE